MFQMRICNQKPSNVLKTRTNKIGNNMTMGNKGRLFLHRIKKEKKNAQSHVRLGQNQPTAAPKKRQCSTTNFIADNSMEDTNIHVQNKVLQLPTKQSTIYKSNQTYGQNHLEKQRKIICVKNKGNMNQNDHMQQGKNNSNAYKIGTNVFLKSWKNRNKNVAVASIVSCDPTRKVAGVELGTEYLMVHVHFPLAKYEELIRPYKGYKIISNVVKLDIAWPAIFVDKINGS
ncbi:uncharacterized protein [Oryza sativa Japonica Group]|uniref:uncharacterized protein isoform X1 n=2 Tax=Oryza sativa subsp. japonica TaxID=39947 RepID=UPI00339BF178